MVNNNEKSILRASRLQDPAGMVTSTSDASDTNHEGEAVTVEAGHEDSTQSDISRQSSNEDITHDQMALDAISLRQEQHQTKEQYVVVIHGPDPLFYISPLFHRV